MQQKINLPTNSKFNSIGISVILVLLGYYFSLMYLINPGNLLWLALCAFPGIVILALKKYDLLVMLLFSLIGFVVREPAPFEVLFVLTVIGLFWFHKFEDIISIFRTHKAIHWCLGLFLLGNTISLLNIQDLTRGISYYAITVYLVSLFYLVWILGRNERYYKAITKGYVLGAFVVASIGLLFYLPRGEFFDQFKILEGVRLISTFQDPNVMAPYLLAAIMILIGEFNRKQLSIKMFVGSIFVLISALFLSFSRAGWGTLLIALVIYAVLSYKSFKKKTVVAFGVTGLALMVVMLAIVSYTGKAEYFLSRLNVTSLTSNDAYRFAYQKQALQILGLARLTPEEQKLVDESNQLKRKQMLIEYLNSSKNVINDLDRNVKYFGSSWTTWEGQNFIKGTYTRSLDKGSLAVIEFEGTSVTVYALADPNRGIAKITLDDKTEKLVDMYYPISDYLVVMYEATNLTPGKHKLVIENTGDKNSLAGATAVGFDAVEVNSTIRKKATGVVAPSVGSILPITFFGIGPGQFEVINFLSPHNSFLKIWVENGYISLLSFLLFLFILLNYAIKNYYKNKDYLKVYLPIVIALLINGLVVDTIHWRHLWIFLALLMLIISKGSFIKETEKAKKST